ncbi:Phosphate-binding protein PstS [Nymphon striatum]|nr:Phosphate-binding protein PstS [Nymphon striatum]
MTSIVLRRGADFVLTLVPEDSLDLGANFAAGREHIEIVGSSTVYPFATVVAETFGKKTKFKTPKIESTGSGGGLKLFCSGNGIDTPDITNSSRRIKKSEGFDGIAIANAKKGTTFKLSLKDIFLALAKEVPGEKEGELIENPYKTWKEVNADLPDTKIEVLALEGGCKKIDWIKALKKTDKNQYKSVCHTVREDGAYIEAGENDNLIVQKLDKNANALGVFGFSFLDQNSDKVKGAFIDDVEISFENIADGSYPVSRPLYFYVKGDHVGKVPGIAEYLAEFTSDEAWGEDGYLTEKGLIPLSEEKREEIGKAAKELTAESKDTLGLIINEVKNLADSGQIADETDPVKRDAALHYQRLQSISSLAKTAIVFVAALLGMLLAWRLIKPELRARNKVETVVRWGMILCASIAILTTVGIVFSVLFESIRFFESVPPTDFLFGTKWSPQTSIRT